MQDTPCVTSYCNNRGVCEKLGLFSICKCFSGYVGNNCEMSEANFKVWSEKMDDLWVTIAKDFRIKSARNYTETQFNTFFLYADSIKSAYQTNTTMANLQNMMDTVFKYFE